MIYTSHCIKFGVLAGKHSEFWSWFYKPNKSLSGKSPRKAIDNGDLYKVIDVWSDYIKTNNSNRK